MAKTNISRCHCLIQWVKLGEKEFRFFSYSYLAKLPEQLNKRAFTKGVCEAGMESKSGIFLGQNSYPPFLVQSFMRNKSQALIFILK